MHLIIDIGTYECADGRCHVTGGPPGRGHAHIEIRDAGKPHYSRRPAWASLSYDLAPTQSATETLRWAVAQLAANLQAPTPWPGDEEPHGPPPEIRTGVLGS